MHDGPSSDGISRDCEDDSESRRFYREFYEAAREHRAAAVVAQLLDFPDLHNVSGAAGSLVILLADTAPELLPAALAAGLSSDAGDEPECQTLLQKAACEGDLETLRLALRYGADPERRNRYGEIALAHACTWGEPEAVRLLVEAGANVNAVEEDPETGYRNTALDCSIGHPEIAAYLRRHGAKHLRELDV